MKKLLSLVLAMALALSLSVTAFAADTTIEPDTNGDPKPSTADTSVEFNVAPTYTITIPTGVELSKKEVDGTVTYEQNANITASAGVRLLNGQSIQVTLSVGTDGFVLTSKEGAILNYTVTVNGSNEPINSDDIVATFSTSADEQKSALHFAANDPTYAGDYSDTVVFTIAIVNRTSANP